MVFDCANLVLATRSGSCMLMMGVGVVLELVGDCRSSLFCFSAVIEIFDADLGISSDSG